MPLGPGGTGGSGECKEIATVSVAADKAACEAVADLITPTECEAVKTAAVDTVAACTYTPAASGCTRLPGWTGSVTATTQPPYYISTLCNSAGSASGCCAPGTTADANGECQDCAAGRYHASATDSSNVRECDECPPGRPEYRQKLGFRNYYFKCLC